MYFVFQEVEANVPPEAQKFSISCCFYLLMWGLNTLEATHDGGGITGPGIQELRERLDLFVTSCQELMRGSPNAIIRDEAYVCLCDLLIVFSEQLGNTVPHLVELCCLPDRNLQLLLNEFVQSYVFVPEQVLQ